MSNIMPYKFNDQQVRIIEQDGDPWFVAKDVAQLLGYRDTSQAIRAHCKGAVELTLPSGRGSQKTIVIPEHDLYRLIMRSKLPAAEEFEEWVVGVVLPSIRKTGSYQVKRPPVEDKHVIKANTLFRSNFAVSKLVFRGNQALLSANVATMKATDVDVLGNIGASHLIAEETDVLLTPTAIGSSVGLSGQKTNLRLEELGLVTVIRDHKNCKQYQLTKEGEKYGVALDTGKKHGNGIPVQQIKWYSRTTDLLRQQPILSGAR